MVAVGGLVSGCDIYQCHDGYALEDYANSYTEIPNSIIVGGTFAVRFVHDTDIVIFGDVSGTRLISSNLVSVTSRLICIVNLEDCMEACAK